MKLIRIRTDSKNYLSNLEDPRTIREIRKIINPPVWKPAGILKNMYSPNNSSPKSINQGMLTATSKHRILP